MSNYLSIATVTATLQHYLYDSCRAEIDDAGVTVLRPTAPTGGAASSLPNPGVNIFLYSIAPNTALMNTDVPTRRADGSLSEKPRAALLLNYLLTFYGNDSTYEPQRLLGLVVRALHTRPLLTRDMIRTTVSTDPYRIVLADSTLAEAPDLVRFTPLNLSLDDMSKLWSTFSEAPYALSVVYQASVVFVEAEESPGDVLPVRERRIHVTPIHIPVIDSIVPQIVHTESAIVIKGRNLQGETTSVRFAETIVVPDPVNTTNEEIAIDLPELRCGVMTVQVVHGVDFQTAVEPHRGFESNVAVFLLSPVIDPDNPVTTVTTMTDDGIVLVTGTMRIGFDRDVGRGQRVSMTLIRYQPPADARVISYRFDAPQENGITNPAQEATDSIQFSFRSVIKGEYLVQVHIDRAGSGFEFDAISGEYIQPRVEIG